MQNEITSRSVWCRTIRIWSETLNWTWIAGRCYFSFSSTLMLSIKHRRHKRDGYPVVVSASTVLFESPSFSRVPCLTDVHALKHARENRGGWSGQRREGNEARYRIVHSAIVTVVEKWARPSSLVTSSLNCLLDPGLSSDETCALPTFSHLHFHLVTRSFFLDC